MKLRINELVPCKPHLAMKRRYALCGQKIEYCAAVKTKTRICQRRLEQFAGARKQGRPLRKIYIIIGIVYLRCTEWPFTDWTSLVPRLSGHLSE